MKIKLTFIVTNVIHQIALTFIAIDKKNVLQSAKHFKFTEACSFEA